MDNLDPGTRRRLRQAQDTARKNKRSAAEQLFRELLADRPDIADAWYGLGTVLADEAEQKAAYSRALELDAGHAEATRALAILRGEIQPEPVEASDEDAPSGLPDAPEPEDLADPRSWSGQTTVAERFDTVEALPEQKVVPPIDEPAPPSATDALVCYKHGNPTNLRCYSCGKPICAKCSKVTPVGYRCLDCIRDAESVFFDASPIHYLISFVTAAFLGAVAAFLMAYIGGRIWFLAFFLGPAAGTFIGNISFRLNGRHRGRYLAYLVAGAVLVSGLPFLFVGNWIGLGIYLFMAVPACYYQLR